jgi:Tfp pilus assembly protein PilV
MKKNLAHNGMSIIEVLIGCAIIAIGIISIINTYSIYVKYALNHDKQVQIAYLLEGGLEAVSLMRDQSWTSNIVPIGTATTSLYFNGTTWTISSTTNEYIDGIFVRNIKVTPVSRDTTTGKISSSGTADSWTRLVTVYVSYVLNNSTTTESLSKYLVNIYNN